MHGTRVIQHRRKAGVSLLVVLIILAALALAAGLAIPAFFARHRVTLDNAAKLIARDLRVAQNWAAYSGEEAIFSFNDDGTGYRLKDGKGRVVERPDQKGIFARSFSADAVFEGIRISDVQCGPDGAIIFDPQGRVLAPGSVRVLFGSDSRVLHVEAPSGLVSIDGLESEWQDTGR